MLPEEECTNPERKDKTNMRQVNIVDGGLGAVIQTIIAIVATVGGAASSNNNGGKK